jgi:hypothetical protein
MTCVPGWEVSLHTSFVALLPPTRGGPLATRRRHLTYKARCGEQAERRCPPHRLAPPPFSSGLGASPVRACVCEGRRLSSARVRYPELTRTAPPSVHRCSAVRRIPNFALPPRYPPPAHHRCSPSRSATVLRGWDFHGRRHRSFRENKRGNGGDAPCRVALSADLCRFSSCWAASIL